ncbi:MAG: NAD(P)-dependent oxidoreductase [Armatimonadetes bacterium]|nr:NAD(P)-dependent oxidoreductase [Armatimonadota bacterium]
MTGVHGRLGPHLVPPFRERYALRTLDRQESPDDPHCVLSDLQDRDVLRRAMAGVDVVVHLAATSDEAPFVENLVPNNVVGVYNVFEAAHEAGVRRIVFASSVHAVTASGPDPPVRVSDPPRPITTYGVTKVFGETLGRYYHDRRGMEFVGIRIGAFQPYDSALLRQKPLMRDLWLSPRDAARLFVRAVETPQVGYALVFGTSRTSLERLSLQEAREVLGYEPEDDVAALNLPEPE